VLGRRGGPGRSGARGAALERRKKKGEGKEGRKERKKREKGKRGRKNRENGNRKRKGKIDKGKEKRFRNLGEMLGKLGGTRKRIFLGFSDFGC
jgi:hypothetical protein